MILGGTGGGSEDRGKNARLLLLKEKKRVVSAESRARRSTRRRLVRVGFARKLLALQAIACLAALPSCREGESESEVKEAIESLKSRPLTYVAIGASDTVGVGAQNPALESWVAILSARLPSNTNFVRLGVSGSTAAEAVEAQLPAAKSARPDLVTIWLAGNDFSMNVPLEDFENSLASIVKGVKEEGKPRVFLANLPDLTTVPAYLMQPRQTLAQRLEEWNQTIARVAEEDGAALVDLYATSKAVGSSIGLIAEDGFHPSTQGYRVIADAFWQEITKDPVLGAVLAPRAQASVSE